MTEFKQFTSLMKILIKSSIIKTKNSQKLNTKSKGSKILMLFFMLIGFMVIAFYLCIMASMITISALSANMAEGALYLFLGLGQLAVLFFGIFAAQNYLFLSKDTQLLCSLPLSNRVVFSAKFVMVYLSELSICILIALPMTLTYAITLTSLGVAIPLTFYLIIFLGLFLLPIIPLLLISIISIPIMYIVSFLRKRALGNGIALGIIMIIGVTLYMLVIGSFSSTTTNENGDMILSPAIIGMLENMPKAMFFNQPLIKSLMGEQTFLNLLFYIGIIIVCGGCALVVATCFYKKALSITIEGTGRSVRNKREVKITDSSNNKKMFVIKEIKTLIQTPTLFMNTIMGVVMPIILMFFFRMTTGAAVEGEVVFDTGMFLTAMITYILVMTSGSTNMAATIGISREGANINILKTLPISAHDVLASKSYLSVGITCLVSILIVTIFPIATGQNFFVGLMIGITNLLWGSGLNFLSLYNDLIHPNFKWNNITELTKNNKRTIKPMIFLLTFGFSICAYGIFLTFLNLGLLAYVLFFVVTIIVGIFLLLFGYKKLFSRAQELFDKIEN